MGPRKSDINLDIGLTLSYIQSIKFVLKVNRPCNWTCGEMSPEEISLAKTARPELRSRNGTNCTNAAPERGKPETHDTDRSRSPLSYRFQ